MIRTKHIAREIATAYVENGRVVYGEAFDAALYLDESGRAVVVDGGVEYAVWTRPGGNVRVYPGAGPLAGDVRATVADCLAAKAA